MSADTDFELARHISREASSGRRRGARPTGTWALNAFVGLVLAFPLLPTVIVIPMSLGEASFIQFPPRGLTLKWYAAYFSDADWMAATWFSLRTALATTLVATVVGTLAAVALVRGRLPGAKAIQALTLAPLIVPHIVAPTVTAALQRIDASLELAALSRGASRWQAFWFVILPSIAPGVAAGAIFAFLASFDEATVAFFISGIDGKTITRKLFEDIDYNLTPIIAAASTVSVLLSLVLMFGFEWIRARGAAKATRAG
jgi:mannopine transport system permease protein